MGSFVNILAVTTSLLWTAAISLFAIPAFLINEEFGHRCHRLWAKGILALMGVHIRYHHLENLPDHVGGILASNHQSQFDIFVLASLPINFKWVSKEEVGRAPFVGWVLKVMGTFFVKRNRSSHDLNVMRDIEEGLRDGKRVAIFPEGTRTRTGEMLPFKKGAFRIAQNSGVPLYPIAIDGTFSIAPAGKLPRRRGHRVTVLVGKPIKVGPEENINEVMQNYRGVLEKLLQECRRVAGGNPSHL